MFGGRTPPARRGGCQPVPEPSAGKDPGVGVSAPSEEPAQPGGVVIIVGRSWLPLFAYLLMTEAIPDGDVVLLVGRPAEATRTLTSTVLRSGAGRVIVSDEPLEPGNERLVTQLLGGRVARLVVSASDHLTEQHTARSLALHLGVPVVGATCGGPGWVGPGVPLFSGSPDQRPGMAMRLARVLAGEVVDALRTEGGEAGAR
jgi:hypothetical protein